jgi:ribosomal protein S18 acetylase RimI-like enzyme
MHLRDWRGAPPSALAPWYEAERRRWMRVLQWDSGDGWREVEQARTTWGLPGLLAIDRGGVVRGFTFYLLEGDRLEIGGLVSARTEATEALLEGLLAAADGARAPSVRGLLLDAGDGLCDVLRRRGFQLGTHRYLTCALPQAAGAPRPDSGLPEPLVAGPWQDEDTPAVAALLRDAYDRDEAELFAPGDAIEAWQTYVGNLVTYAGCGVLNRAATRVVRDGDAVAAVALVTDISPGVAHLVQLAVAHPLRGRAIGRRLVAEVCDHLSGLGYSAITLMVSASNQAANRLYETCGFRQGATFLSASATRPAGDARSSLAPGP